MLLLVLVLLLPIGPAPAENPAGSALAVGRDRHSNDTVTGLLTEYWQWKLDSYPEWSTEKVGEPGRADRLEDFSLAGVEARLAACNTFLQRSQAVTGVAGREAGWLAALRAELLPCRTADRHRAWLLPPVTGLAGLQLSLPELVTSARLASTQDYQHLLARLEAMATQIDQVVELLRAGAAAGVTYARESLAGVDSQLEGLQTGVEQSVFYRRFRDMPGSLGTQVQHSVYTTTVQYCTAGGDQAPLGRPGRAGGEAAPRPSPSADLPQGGVQHGLPGPGWH